MSKNDTVIATHVGHDTVNIKQTNNKKKNNSEEEQERETVVTLNINKNNDDYDGYSKSVLTTNNYYHNANNNVGANEAFNNSNTASKYDNSHVIINKSLADCDTINNVWMDYKKLKTCLLLKDKQNEKVIVM